MPDQLHFRHVMGHFTTGVTVVTSRRPDGSPCGLTANSVASVSLDPVLVLVCLDRAAASHSCVIDGGAFAVCILGSDAEHVARLFSEGERAERFAEAPWRRETTGSPVLEDALAWLDCRVQAVHEAGDHSIVVGEVRACGARDGDPLVFYRGEYHRIAPGGQGATRPTTRADVSVDRPGPAGGTAG
jgi:flavin reductase (DIM6/NTAB) family NADH-FMN oxidoreductase RutF